MNKLISLQDVSLDDLEKIFRISKELKKNRKQTNHLKGKSVVLLFLKESTRTRTAFQTAIYELKGNPVYLFSKTTQLEKGESIKDTAKVLSRYVHGIGARVYEQESLEKLSEYSSIPIVNLLSDKFHPTQIVGDLFTIKEEFGGFRDLKLAYVGDGNNIANSLLLGCSKVGLDLSIASPKGYWPSKDIIKKSEKNANRSVVEITTEPEKAVNNCDILYTDTHFSLGQKKSEKKIENLKPYQVNKKLIKHAKKQFKFMHCLPAHPGEEVTKDIIYGPNSIVFKQAENKLHTAKGILISLLK